MSGEFSQSMSAGKCCGDSIEIEGIKAQTRIGFVPWEQEVRQEVLIDLELCGDFAAAGVSDDEADAFDYKLLVREVIAHAEGKSFRLVEALAVEIADELLEKPQVYKACVRVTKVGALRHAERVSVKICRCRTADRE